MENNKRYLQRRSREDDRGTAFELPHKACQNVRQSIVPFIVRLYGECSAVDFLRVFLSVRGPQKHISIFAYLYCGLRRIDDSGIPQSGSDYARVLDCICVQCITLAELLYDVS